MYLWISGENYERWSGDGENRGKVTLDWTPDLQAEETTPDGDKTLTVPADTEWIVKWLWVEYTGVGAGVRQIVVQIQDDAADVIGEIRPAPTQDAVARNYMFGPHLADIAAFRDTDWEMTPMPEWILPAGYGLRVYDNNAVAPAADTALLQMMVLSRSV